MVEENIIKTRYAMMNDNQRVSINIIKTRYAMMNDNQRVSINIIKTRYAMLNVYRLIDERFTCIPVLFIETNTNERSRL